MECKKDTLYECATAAERSIEAHEEVQRRIFNTFDTGSGRVYISSPNLFGKLPTKYSV